MSGGTSLRKVAAGAGGVVLLGYGTYYATHSSQVSALEREKTDLETKVFVAQGKSRKAENAMNDNTSLVKVLQQQAELQQKSASELSQQLELARDKVKQLEAQQAQKEADLKKIDTDISKARKSIDQARIDVQRYKDEAKLTEKALQTISQQVADARKQLNPLNHPAIRDLLRGK